MVTLIQILALLTGLSDITIRRCLYTGKVSKKNLSVISLALRKLNIRLPEKELSKGCLKSDHPFMSWIYWQKRFGKRLDLFEAMKTMRSLSRYRPRRRINKATRERISVNMSWAAFYSQFSQPKIEESPPIIIDL